METVIYIITLLVWMSFVGAFIYLSPRWSEKGQAHKKFFTALNNVLQESSDISEQVRQVNLNFKKLSENNRYVSREVHRPEDLLENLFYILDTGNEKYLKSLQIKIIPGIRRKTLKVLDEMRKQDPFSSLPPREANLMSSLSQAVEEDNKNLSNGLLRELAQEIDKTHSTLRILERKNHIAYTVSTVGIILTTFFGIMSVIT